MHSQIYSGLSLISAISRNFRVAGENGFILARWANNTLFNMAVFKTVLYNFHSATYVVHSYRSHDLISPTSMF